MEVYLEEPWDSIILSFDGVIDATGERHPIRVVTAAVNEGATVVLWRYTDPTDHRDKHLVDYRSPWNLMWRMGEERTDVVKACNFMLEFVLDLWDEEEAHQRVDEQRKRVEQEAHKDARMSDSVGGRLVDNLSD